MRYKDTLMRVWCPQMKYKTDIPLKQILLINDVVGYGKVGMGAMLPVLSYLGVPTYSLPTALVSNTLNYGQFNIQETTEYIRGTLPVWRDLGFRFDAVCTGLMFSREQAELVSRYCAEVAECGTTVFVDPILGDGGQLYNGVSDEQVRLMREMVGVAHLTFPNYTEACYLTGTPFQPEGISWNKARQMIDALRNIGSKSVLVTSCRIDGNTAVAGYNAANGEYFHEEYDEIPGLFHGTGDIFSAVLIGHLLNEEPLRQSTLCAMHTVAAMLDRYRDTQDRCHGIPVERCLDLL